MTHARAYASGSGFTRQRSRAERVKRLESIAAVMDTAFVVPGTGIRFGFDGLVGLVPGVGDVVTTALSLYLVHEAWQLGAPKHLIGRMLANVALDGAIGAVPVAGDVFDVLWRANKRNMRMLREWMEREGVR
ncbi:MAG TPA: DUF4112 domain-containing protein [Pseudorhodoplanes sp.]|nr:DUF4112 domain-containing protein [Pseudorhodoplanes sp.]